MYWLIFALIIKLFLVSAGASNYEIGVGIHDVTGPIAGVNMMGYAMPQQVTKGIHMRLFARAFIFVHRSSGNRVVFCSVDVTMISPQIKRGVLKILQEKYGSELYRHENVMLSATHTHSAPGGFNDYLLYSLTSFGYVSETADLMILGIAGAIERAHASLKPASFQLGSGQLLSANINRSPTSYILNPFLERVLYKSEGNTDKTMIVLKIVDSDSGRVRGAISWFSVHCTSLKNTNTLVSGDNKGYASYLMERSFSEEQYGTNLPFSSSEAQSMRQNGSAFVAAFAQTAAGDSSPNTEGAFCLNTGEPCDPNTSTCKDRFGIPRNSLCHSHGPNWKNGGDFEANRVIGLRQFLKANSILASMSADKNTVQGDINYVHAWIDLSNTTVRLENGELVRTCLPARGFGFAAGTTDGPGAIGFIQGNNGSVNPLWNFAKRFLSEPSRAQKQCHAPKPILLNTGEIKFPYPWEPKIVDIQVFQIGRLFILAVPAEFTTMAGRRVKQAVQTILKMHNIWPDGGAIVISGLSNSYSGYVATYEEYLNQRYEGASTIYGPHTLSVYIQEFKRLALELVRKNGKDPRDLNLPPPSHEKTVPSPDFTDKLISLLPTVLYDPAPLFGMKFGDSYQKHRKCFWINETVEYSFLTGHPRHYAKLGVLHLERSFFRIEKYIGKVPSPTNNLNSKDEWMIVRDDNDFDTELVWSKRLPLAPSVSTATVKWKLAQASHTFASFETRKIPDLTGIYRIRFFGANKRLSGKIVLHEGLSPLFQISSNSSHCFEDTQFRQ